MSMERCLNEIKPGDTAVVRSLRAHGSMRRRLLDIGLVEGTRVECVGVSPMGDPAAYLIRGAVIAIRSADSRNVLIKEEQHGSDQ
ncbi:MAG: FeoA family protein [Oscillospiraceae bacterium]|nr:FeoA family protein [Oscillospiraceae bacterium]